MPFLTAQQILNKDQRRFKNVEVPDLGSMRIASLDAASAFEFRALQRRQEKGEDVEATLIALLLAASCVDEKNAPLFTRDQAASALSVLSPQTVAFLVREITAHLSPPAEKSAEGNSEASRPAA